MGSNPTGGAGYWFIAGWRNRQTRESQKLVPHQRAWEFKSPPGDFSGSCVTGDGSIASRRAGARPGLISPAAPDRYRGLGLFHLVISVFVPSSSGQGPCLTNRRSQVRVLPG